MLLMQTKRFNISIFNHPSLAYYNSWFFIDPWRYVMSFLNDLKVRKGIKMDLGCNF